MNQFSSNVKDSEIFVNWFALSLKNQACDAETWINKKHSICVIRHLKLQLLYIVTEKTKAPIPWAKNRHFC
jgi:hypothetical protein